MIMGLCGSFAVVPAFSLVGHVGGIPPHDAGAAGRATLADTPNPVTDPASAAAVLLAVAATLDGPPKTGTAHLPPAIPPAAIAPAALPPAVPRLPARPVTGPVPRAANPPSASLKAGQATWLDTIPTGTCANNDAPMGALITVTNLTGTSITCRVVSRGPFAAGRIVDVARSTFRTLAATSQGVISVAVSW